MIYNDAIAAKAETMGFDGILAEGVERNLKGKSPNFLYRAPETARIKTCCATAGYPTIWASGSPIPSGSITR